MIRQPKLKPSARRGKILPGFDIHIGELAIKRLEIGPGVSGQPRSGTLRGKADVRSGRALVELAARFDNGGDRIALKLDAEPDRDRFDIEARVISPANGVVPALVGTRRAIGLSIGGNGSWTRWRGKAALDLSGKPAARLALGRRQRPLPARRKVGRRPVPHRQVPASDDAQWSTSAAMRR